MNGCSFKVRHSPLHRTCASLFVRTLNHSHMIRYCRRIPGHCARSVHSSTRLTYVLVPDPSPAGAEKSHRNSSNLGTPLPSSWYPIDCSRLNLSNQFATNPVAHLSPISLSQEDQSRGSDGSCQSGVVKITSPNIVAPPKPPGPEDCCMSGTQSHF